MTPKSASNKIKNKQKGQYQAKSFCTAKETISKMEWQPTEWEKIFADQLSDKGLIASIHKEGWTPKNWCFWTVVLEKTLESPWDCKEIKPVNPKGNQFWIYVERINAEAETLILWPPDVKNRLIWKDLDAGKDWRQEEKEMTEDKMVGWHHKRNGHEFRKLRELVMDRESWHAAAHEVTKSQTRLSN